MIVLENIKKFVPGQEILKGISVRIDRGLTFITGDSGVGKSTLMNMISTMDAPTEGTVRYEIGDLAFEYAASTGDEEASNFRARHLGIIFQDFNLVGDMNAEKNIRLGGALAGIPARTEKIHGYLSAVNLSDNQDKPMNVMSGGERQRVAIARALYKDVDILLADEPTGNLDEKNTDDIFTRLKEISKNKTVIVISHNMEMARKYGDRILRMQDGHIVEDTVNETSNPAQKHSPKKKEAKKRETSKSDVRAFQKPGIPADLVKDFAHNNIKKFRWKFVSMVAVMGLALAGAGILFSMNHLLSNEADSLNFTYYDADQVDLHKTLRAEAAKSMLTSSLYEPISLEEEEQIKNIMGFAETVPVASWGYGIIQNGSSEKISLKAIRLNDFFEKRIMSDQIEGRFPADKSEMIVGKDISEKYFDGDGIGKSILIEDNTGNQYSFTICGINRAKNVDGIYFSYVSFETLLEGKVPPGGWGFLYLAEEMNDPNQSAWFSVSGGRTTESFSEDELIAGKIPAVDGELAVGMDVAIELYRAITGNYPQYSLSEIQSGNPEALSMLDAVFEHDYYISLNAVYPCKVVGLHGRSNTDIFAMGTWLNQATTKQANSLECYFGDMNRTRKADFSKITDKYDYKSYYLERFDTAVDTQDMWKMMFLFGSLLSLVTVFALANSYARVTLSERIYEIGIIKSLGGGKKEISRLLRADQIYLGGASGLLATCIYLLVLLVFRLTGKGVMSSWYLTLAVVASLILGGLLCCLLFSYGKISKTVKTKPIEDFRKRM